MIDYKSLGKRIKDLRLSKNITQTDIAKMINISNRYMSDIERGTTKLSLTTIVDIANSLDTSVDKLLSDSVKDSKVIYNKEVKELIDDLNHYELKIIIDMIKSCKDAIRKYAENERNKLAKKKNK